MKNIFLIIFVIILFSSSGESQIKKEKVIDSLDIKIGQMIMIGFRGLECDVNSKTIQDIHKYHLGGVVLFDYDVPSKSPVRNIKNLEQVKSLCDSLQKYSSIPLLISIDQEGGRVNRLKVKFGFPPTVSAQYLGGLNNPDSTKKYSESNALTLKNIGINLNFAPCVDLNTNPNNPVIGKIERSFSPDSKIVTSNALEVIKTHHNFGILNTLKHFPGHGSSKYDSHLGFVDVTETWDEKELEPYINIINAGECDVVMTAHIFNSKLDSKYPATLSKNIITDILRKKLNYNGVVISDDMQMKAIADHYGIETAIELAINAGVDVVIFANNTFVYVEDMAEKAFLILKNLVANGRISRDRINQSFDRIMKLKSNLKK